MNLTFSWTLPRRLMECAVCKTHTVHSQMKSGEWICGCATIHPPAETWTIGDQTIKNLPKWNEEQNQ